MSNTAIKRASIKTFPNTLKEQDQLRETASFEDLGSILFNKQIFGKLPIANTLCLQYTAKFRSSKLIISSTLCEIQKL